MKHWLAKVLAIGWGIQAVGVTMEGISRSRSPRPAWMNSEWPAERFVIAMVSAALAGSCVAYIRRMSRLEQDAEPNDPRLKWPFPWNARPEFRFGLYVCVFGTLIKVLLEICRSILAAKDPSAPIGVRSFGEMFRVDWIVAVSVIVGIILYDRYRVRNALLETPGFCSTCGYDLRATSDRCPECGTPINSGTKRYT